MRKLVFILLLLATTANAAHVQFDFRDFVTGSVQRQPVKIEPLSAPTPNENTMVVAQQINTNTYTGSIIVSNMVAGSYRVTVTPPSALKITTFYIAVPDSNALLQASSLFAGPTNSAVFQAMDARYARTSITTNLGLDLVAKPGIVLVGDSLTTGEYAEDATSYGVKLLGRTNWSSYRFYTNFGISGRNTEDMNFDYVSQGATVRPSITNGQNSFFFLWGGINDVLQATATATSLENLRSTWAQARADGYRVVAFTIPLWATSGSFSSNSTTFQGVTNLNHAIRTNSAFYDHLIDVYSFLPYSDATRISDKLHLSALGNLLVASNIALTIFPQQFTAQSPPTAGNVIYVDQDTGNDWLARANSKFPSLTLTNAKAIASAGDTIIVRPGNYTNNNLLKVAVNWHFEAGARVYWQDPDSGSGYGIFDDRATGATTNRITGAGFFYFKGNNYSNINIKGAVVLTNAASDLDFEADQITISILNVAGSNSRIAALAVLDCAVSRFNVGIITDAFVDWPNPTEPLDPDVPSNATGVYWEKGEMHVRFHRITMDSAYGIWASDFQAAATTNNLYCAGDFLSVQGVAIYCDSDPAHTGINMRVWIAITEIDCPNLSLSLIGTNRVYVSAQKIASGLGIDCSFGTTLWLNAQKLTSKGTSGLGQWLTTATGGSSTAYLTVEEFEDTGTIGTSGIRINGASTYVQINGGRMRTSAASSAPIIQHLSGTAIIQNAIIDASADNVAANYPITVASNGLTLQGCRIITAAASAEAIRCTVATTQAVVFVATTADRPITNYIELRGNFNPNQFEFGTNWTIKSGASITNAVLVSPNISNGFVTNNGVIWYSTNNTPTLALPNGSIATVTDGRFYVRTNSAWVQH